MSSRRHKTTEETRHLRAGPSRPTPLLRLLHHPEQGVVEVEPRRLAAGRHVMGRDVDGQSILVDDARASRVHAVLHVASRSHRVRLSDEGSRNGTRVNGQRIDEAWLDDGDVIRVADTHYFLRMEPPDHVDAVVEGLVGVTPVMGRLRHTIRRVAEHEVTVLILGESGSGKELVAEAIHHASGRTGAFVAVNCSAIPEQLAESQLFGHVAGAFTGARADSEGFFRAADGGTMFLDEVGDMALHLQPKLLRVLEQREVVPVGSTTPTTVDVRIVAATHRRLGDSVEQGSFRGDLYARLSEFTLTVPPLRERRDDTLLLLRRAYGEGMPPLEPELVDALMAYDWPYNVRELMAVGRELKVRADGQRPLGLELVAHRLGEVARELVGAKGATVRSGSDHDTDSGVRAAPPTREEFERILIECKGNVRQVAKATARSRMQVYRWVDQFGFDLDNYRQG